LPRVTNLELNRRQVTTPHTGYETPITEPVAEQSRDEVMNVIVYEVVITLVISTVNAA
jgi:hypothetical protein